MVLLCELRTALSTCVYEMESLKHQYEASCPGKVLFLIMYDLQTITFSVSSLLTDS